MKRVLPFLFTAIMCLGACSNEPSAQLDIFHTNDIEGFYWTRNYAENNNRPTGGMSVLKNLLAENDKSYFLFDSGNSFSKTQEGKLFKLEGAINLMNLLGYNAATLSHNDLALGWEVTEIALKKAKFPIVVTNLTFKDGSRPKYIEPYAILEKNGIKAAIVGLMSKKDFPDTLRNSSLLIKDERESLKSIFPELEKHNPDIIILLSSIGFDLDRAQETADEKFLAEEFPELTLILGGNTDVSGTQTEEISQTLVTRNKPMLFEIAKINLSFNKDKQLKSYQREEILLDKDTFGLDKEVEAQTEIMRNAAKKTTGRKITSLKADMPSYGDKPSPLGSYTAACIKRWGKNEIGIINSDAFLNGFEQGPLSEGQLNNAIPFNDRVMFIKMRGDELKNALEHSILTKNNWPQTSGLTISYNPNAELGKKIKKIYINGVPARDEQLYSISTSDHIVAGGMGHNEFLNVFEFKNTDRTVRDIIRWCMNREKEILPSVKEDWKEI